MQEDAISALTSLGLSQGEAKTYLALASVSTSQATPLAELADVPQPRIYSYLDTLVSKDLVTKTKISGKPNEYHANDYEVVFEKLQKQLQNRIDTAKKYIKEQQIDDSSTSTSMVKVIQGKNAIFTALQSLSNDTKDNVYVLNHPFYANILERTFDGSSYDIHYLIDVIRTHPMVKNLVNSPLGEVVQRRKLMIILQDADFSSEKPTVSSLSIIAFPSEDEGIDPVMISIFHPVVLDLQIHLISGIMRMLSG